MFSGSSSAASALQGTSAVDPVAPQRFQGAATGPAAADSPSFDDALSAADGETEEAPPAYTGGLPVPREQTVPSRSTAEEGEPGRDRRVDDQRREPTLQSGDDASPAIIVAEPAAVVAQPAAALVILSAFSGAGADLPSAPEGTASQLPSSSLRQLLAAARNQAAVAGASAEPVANPLEALQVQPSDADFRARFEATGESLPVAELADDASDSARRVEIAGGRLQADGEGRLRWRSSSTASESGDSATPARASLQLDLGAPATSDRPAASAVSSQARGAVAAFAHANIAAARLMSTSGLAQSSTLAAALSMTEPAEAVPASVGQQIIDAIRLEWSGNRSAALIQLEPTHFGEMSVSLRVDDGQVTARVEASNPAVREWMQNNQALLKSGLAEHNLTLNHLEIAEPSETRDGERRNREQEASQESRPPRRQRRTDIGELFEVVA